MTTRRLLPRRPLARFSEGGARLPETEIFATGEQRGKQYQRADLDDMVRNFNAYSRGQTPGFRVPAVIGHEEGDERFRAFKAGKEVGNDGVVSELRHNGKTLLAQFEDVSPELSDGLKTGKWRAVSAEIYDEPPGGIPGKGKMLRRVAFLGSEIPQVKTLKPPPRTVINAELRSRYERLILTKCEPSATAGAYLCFSETRPMRDEMLKKLAEKGLDPEALKDAPDVALAEVCRMADDMGGDDNPAMYDEEPPDLDDDEEKKKFAERCAKMKAYAEKGLAKYDGSDELRGKNQKGQMRAIYAKSPPDTDYHSEIRKAVAAEFKNLKNELGAKVSAVEKFAEERIAAEKKATAQARLEALKSLGKVLPSQEEGFLQIALGLDATRIEKFAEAGKEVKRTAFDNFFETLKNGPNVVKFGERFKDGDNPNDAGMEPADRKKWAQAVVTKFSETFKKTGVSTKEFVEMAEKADDQQFAELQANWKTVA